MGKFQDKVVLITGASGGIGGAAAVAFAKEGAKVAITGRNEERLENTEKLCKEKGAEVLSVICDLSKFENIEILVNKTVERFSVIDILINNAGCGRVSPIENLSLDTFELLFQTNVRAPVFLCKYALPHLKKTKGCVVNVSSIISVAASPSNVTYAITKSALDHFTRGFAAECVQAGVRVNSINPAFVDTDFVEKFGVDPKLARERMNQFLKRQTLGLITPETVAEGISFLCSSTHITGTSLMVDGGLLLPS